jgi:hypothetical protein
LAHHDDGRFRIAGRLGPILSETVPVSRNENGTLAAWTETISASVDGKRGDFEFSDWNRYIKGVALARHKGAKAEAAQ